jgi:hypothetical protein
MDRQGSKIVEDVTKIVCSKEPGEGISSCKVYSEGSLPTRYNDIDDVDMDKVSVADADVLGEKRSYSFERPVQCSVVFGTEVNKIECED